METEKTWADDALQSLRALEAEHMIMKMYRKGTDEIMAIVIIVDEEPDLISTLITTVEEYDKAHEKDLEGATIIDDTREGGGVRVESGGDGDLSDGRRDAGAS